MVSYFVQFLQFYTLTLSLLVNFCCLLITFANSMDPDQDPTKRRTQAEPILFDVRVFLKI